MTRQFGIADAIKSLGLGSGWKYSEEDYDTLEWSNEEIPKPTKEVLEEEIARLQHEYDVLEYQRLRAAEYPPYADYLDGVVKGDQAQIDAYIAACQAVKAKYPKPE